MRSKLIAALLILWAISLRAQSADTLYLPIVAHAAPYATEVRLTNASDDAVNISATFIRANASDTDPNVPLARYTSPAYRLGPHEERTVEAAALGVDGVGMLILESCLSGADCGPVYFVGNLDFARAAWSPKDPRFTLFPFPRAFRNISAEVHVFAAGTKGSTYAAVPWWATIQAGDGPVTIPDVRADSRFRTTVGVVNASNYSSVVVISRLLDEHGIERGWWAETICPLCSVRRSAESMFPALALNRLNRQLVVNPSVRFELAGVIPNDLAARQKDVAPLDSCADGCGQFIPYTSVTDNLTGEFRILTAQWRPEVTSIAAASSLRVAAKTATARTECAECKLPSVESLATSTVQPDAPPACSLRIVGPFTRCSTPPTIRLEWLLLDASDRIITTLTENEVKEARWRCLSDEKVTVATGGTK